jgi:16S rRNA C967 or C1407 C5-methylase (RsmB/RsmF family)
MAAYALSAFTSDFMKVCPLKMSEDLGSASNPAELTSDAAHNPRVGWMKQRTSAALEEYYRLHLGLEEAELQQMLAVMREKLPVTFRVNATQTHYESLVARLKSPEFVGSFGGGLKVTGVEWYPGDLVWSLNSNRRDLKKQPGVKALHTFIQEATDSGLISRQELVSMIPPLVLDVRPGHRVLDTCAAPGSKTAQILELINSRGLVVANEVDSNRAFMLIHQLQRTNTTNVCIVSHPAQHFPDLGFAFDRVLCDVPCTGDGALRKLASHWRKWKVRDAQTLHALQVSILSRALTLVGAGGLVCYSTCSLNPIENEAVVCEALRRFEGSIELVDLREVLGQKCPGLRVRPGLRDWKVLSNSKDKTQGLFVQYPSYANVPAGLKRIIPSMFPVDVPPQILHTVRVLPHDQDTGGFFIALFRISAPYKSTVPHEPMSSKTEKRFKPSRGQTEYMPVPEDCAEYQAICEYWGVSLESQLHSHLYCPSAKARKNLYFVSSEVIELLAADARSSNSSASEAHLVTSDSATQQDEQADLIEVPSIRSTARSLNLLNMGVKVFTLNRQKTTQACQYRLTQDGLPFVSHLLTKRKVVVEDQDVLGRFIAEKTLDIRTEGDWKAELGDNGYYVLVFPSVGEEVVAMKVSDEKLVNMLPDEHAHCLRIKHFLGQQQS